MTLTDNRWPRLNTFCSWMAVSFVFSHYMPEKEFLKAILLAFLLDLTLTFLLMVLGYATGYIESEKGGEKKCDT